MRVNILHIRPLKFETCIVYIFLLARILHVPTCVGISPIKPAPEDYAHPALQVYLVLMHTLKHTQLSLSYSFFFFPFLGGWVALLWACSCILGFLTGSQGANRTPLYLWGVGDAFRLSCRRWDETQRGRTITGCYSMNEQRPLEIASSQPGGSRRFLRTGESANLQTYRIRRDMRSN